MSTGQLTRFSTACTIRQLKIIDLLYFQDPVLCSMFWCIPTWKANKFHQTAACHSVLLPQAFRRKLLEAKPYAIGVAGQIFYLLHGNWRAQSLDLRSLFSCFLLRATKHRLRSKLSKFFIQYFPCSSTCLLQFILWSIFRHFSTLGSNI